MRAHVLLGCPDLVSTCASWADGFSKLAVIAATKVHARQYPALKINACCP
jgi:hypothetical protein